MTAGRLGSLAVDLRRRRQLRETARALTPPAPHDFAAYGKGTLVIPPARVELPGCIDMGADVMVHEHAWLCVQRRDGLPDPLLRIGDGCSFNRFVKVVCHGSVTFGKGVLVGDRVYVSDVEYEPVAGGAPRLTEPRPVVVEDGVLLGVGVVVKPGVRIGAGAYIGASAVVDFDVPPHSLAAGNPARVLRRLDPGSGRWEPVSET